MNETYYTAYTLQRVTGEINSVDQPYLSTLGTFTNRIEADEALSASGSYGFVMVSREIGYDETGWMREERAVVSFNIGDVETL